MEGVKNHFPEYPEPQGAIMSSLDPIAVPGGSGRNSGPSKKSTTRSDADEGSGKSLPDVLSTELQSLNLHADESRLSFLLVDSKDQLTVDSETSFTLRLGCEANSKAKVISIVGNTGEGKSYLLNKSLFGDYDGEEGTGPDPEVFNTSSSAENSCTRGVWAAYEPRFGVVVLDTEGMLGNGGSGAFDEPVNENLRTRQLLKVLAVSDIVIYKTKAERLHSDLFYFLGDASKSYNDHFSQELAKIFKSGKMGPTIIIFHETQFTEVLSPKEEGGHLKTPEVVIRERLAMLNQDISAFNKISYFGAKRKPDDTLMDEMEIFRDFRKLLKDEIQNVSVRSPRSLGLIYKTFQSLNEKFSGHINSASHRSFPDEYFTCQSRCGACESRCHKAMNHENEHSTKSICIYQKTLDNKRFFCLRCYQNGRRVIVVPKASSSEDSGWLGLATYAWSGYVLECKICGVIFRSRQHWYGNETPETQQVVHSEISHIWPGTRSLQGTQNAARRFLDGVQVISSTVSSFSTAVGPSKGVSGWVADKIAPDYWRPNAEIFNCRGCNVLFNKETVDIHHCRSCGEGFCDECSSFRRPVPERGWHPGEPVRVCQPCYTQGQVTGTRYPETANGRAQNVNARRYGEKVVGTLGSLASAVLEYPISALKDSARPSYWVPDEEIECCFVCDTKFDKGGSMSTSSSGLESQLGEKTRQSLPKLHHCRGCGEGVCDDCSKSRIPVPNRGWDQPVRVCDKCYSVLS